jgi:hypothetical protein
VTDLVREYTLPREHLLRPPAKVQALKGVSFAAQRAQPGRGGRIRFGQIHAGAP